jgi:hypothetical protein
LPPKPLPERDFDAVVLSSCRNWQSPVCMEDDFIDDGVMFHGSDTLPPSFHPSTRQQMPAGVFR